MASQEQIQFIPLDRLFVERQVREQFNDESLHGLSISLKEVGQLQPIRVRKAGEKYQVVDGERRLKAAHKAGLSTMAAIVETKELGEGEILLRQMVSNVQRDDLLPMDTANKIRRIMDMSGWNASQAAARLGLSNASVTRFLSLLSLPLDIQERIAAGDIAVSAAYELSRIDDVGTRDELAQKLASGKLTRDGLVGVRKAARKGTDAKTAVQPSRVTAVLGSGRSVTVTSEGLSLERFIEVISELLEKARRVRPQGVELGTFIAMLRDQARVS